MSNVDSVGRVMQVDEGFRQRMAETKQRREMLARNIPACPKCGEQFQMQLTWWFGEPAEWKCRMCRTKFTFEPTI